MIIAVVDYVNRLTPDPMTWKVCTSCKNFRDDAFVQEIFEWVEQIGGEVGTLRIIKETK